MLEKRRLRQELRRQLRARDAATNRQESARLREQLDAWEPACNAPAIAAYVAFGAEPDLGPWLRAQLARGARLALPRFDRASGVYQMATISDWERDLAPGLLGILEPRTELPTWDAGVGPELLWLVPGMAFGLAGVRLGRGGGYYDRLLAGQRGWRVGVAWALQVREHLPAEDHDVRLNALVTPAGVTELAGSGANDRRVAEQGNCRWTR